MGELTFIPCDICGFLICKCQKSRSVEMVEMPNENELGEPVNDPVTPVSN
jgi:hypothetical protein